MKAINALSTIAALLLFMIAVSSCDEDFNTIGADIIGDDDLLSQTQIVENVTAFSKKLDPIQTNIVPVQRIGVYNDQTFGKATSNFLTQVVLPVTDPIFADSLGQPIEFNEALLYIPFFSESEGTGNDVTFTLDSIFGSSPINISVYESNYFLRDLDPDSNFQDPQLYYSNQTEEFENNLGEFLITIEDFVPSNEPYYITETSQDEDGEEVIDTVSVIPPGIRVEMPKEFFQEKIFDKEGSQELSSNNNFKEYFRGLYFEVESANDAGNMFIFNPETANITLYYTYEEPELDTSGAPVLDEEGNPIINTIEEEFAINFGGIGLNTYENEMPPGLISDLENQDQINGEDNLFVRGGEGVITVINLFSGVDSDEDGISDEIDDLRDRQVLVNDANLRFYVNQNEISGGSSEPERLIIYDIENNRVLADYFLDTTTGNDPLNAIIEHLGRLERGSDGNGEYYDINITNHVSNLINKDSTNVSLGLMVSQQVLLSGFHVVDSLSNPDSGEPKIKEIPRSSVISPEGTVLYGNNTTNEDKKLKLVIKYLNPN